VQYLTLVTENGAVNVAVSGLVLKKAVGEEMSLKTTTRLKPSMLKVVPGWPGTCQRVASSRSNKFGLEALPLLRNLFHHGIRQRNS
jgi:hypothetical protein